MGGKSIKVSDYVYAELIKLKEGKNHTSLDSVLRELLYRKEVIT